MRKETKLTALEKQVLKDAFLTDEGTNDLKASFICFLDALEDDYTPAEKRAVKALERKGLIEIENPIDNDDIPTIWTGKGWTKQELLEVCEFQYA